MTEMRKPQPRSSTADDTAATDSLERMSEVLSAQAVHLDAMFAELVQHSTKNFQNWPGTTHRYMQLALRAQANCRATLEAVVRADRAKREARGDTAA